VAFIWLAVDYFDVDTEVIWVLFVFSVIFVVALAIPGVAGALLLRWFRRGSGGMLDRLEKSPKDDTKSDS
jgi:uncharacterized membrane protein